MRAARQQMSLGTTWIILALVLAPVAVEAQVGLSSGAARVTLIARSEPRGAIRTVEPMRQTAGSGRMVEAAATVRLSANTGYRLMVRGRASTSRIWVRDLAGNYQELTSGSPVTVARDSRCAGEWNREVHYRIELSEGGDLADGVPVRYELAIDPAI